MMMTSLISKLWQASYFGAWGGFGSGCLFIPSVTIVATCFTQKRIFAVAIAAEGSSIGGVIYPIVFYRLVHRTGFGWAAHVVAFIALVTLAIPCIVMKSRVQTSKARTLLLPRVFLEVPFSLFTVGLFVGFMAL